ncbi:hypothetical protein SAMN04489724_0254 [Algoriphagus locisalis]|uniref:Uncharacterized protein n=1 Tax=Algoriphagus locisalis TaxID=305507 RepID=A0A1I7E8K7_9BACT|nr:hypothetical protein [Algoriphagus locisalis]SFU20153.1 hypothetical protein SAMN04489724_0254 [Algoriphagus locisalis]
MKEGLIKDAYEALIKELQTILTVAYIFSVAVGMLFTHHKYKEFNINIFDYADILDFLIAPFSDFAILWFIIASSALIGLLLVGDTYFRKKYPYAYSRFNFGIDKKQWFSQYRVISFIILFALYLVLAAQAYGSYYKKQVMESSPIEIRFADNETKRGLLVGKTKDIIFLLDGERISAIPITSFLKEYQLPKK